MALFDRRSQTTMIAVNDEQAQAIARGTEVGSGGGKKGGEFARKLRGRRSEIAVENAGEVNLPMNTAWLDTGPTTIPYGARGRNPGGWPEVIPVGVPPAVAGEPHRLAVPKELRIPQIPGNFANFVAVPGGAAGDLLQEPISFPARTIQIDNYTSCFIYVNGVERFIPPLTMGWQFVLGRGITTIYCRGLAPGLITQPAFTAGGVFYVFAYEAALVSTTSGSAV
jgi:hypothetical protein